MHCKLFKLKSAVVLEESPLVKDDKTVKVSAMSKGTGINTKNKLVLKYMLTIKNMMMSTWCQHAQQYLSKPFMVLKEFHFMILSAILFIHTDHKNLAFATNL